MSDDDLRDTFAAAALTGLAGCRNEHLDNEIPGRAYRLADAMLAERAKIIAQCDTAQKLSESDSFCADADHDAAPAARAEDELKEPNGSSTGEPGGEPESTVRTGKQTAPPCVETDGFSSGSSSELINRNAERQSPASTEESSPLDDTRPDKTGEATGGRGHNTQEPVAWGVIRDGGEVVDVWMRRQNAVNAAGRLRTKATAVPLYRHPQPTLTDAEREAVEWCVEMAVLHATECDDEIAALRGLLERTK